MARKLSCRVIALPDSDRLEAFFHQEGSDAFRGIGAFDGRRGDIPSDFDMERYVVLHGREPRGGEVGCSVSHYRAMRDFVHEGGPDDDWLLVLEDDTRWSGQFWPVVHRIQRSGLSAFISLGDGFSVQDRWLTMSQSQKLASVSLLSRPIGRVGLLPRLVGTVGGTMWGTGGYMIDRRSARLLVNAAQEEGIYWNADDFSLWPSEIRICMVRPGLLRWEGESTISDAAGYSYESPQDVSMVQRFRMLLAPRVRVERLKRSAQVAFKDLKRMTRYR